MKQKAEQQRCSGSQVGPVENGRDGKQHSHGGESARMHVLVTRYKAVPETGRVSSAATVHTAAHCACASEKHLRAMCKHPRSPLASIAEQPGFWLQQLSVQPEPSPARDTRPHQRLLRRKPLRLLQSERQAPKTSAAA